MTAVRKVYTLIKIIALVYGISVSAFSFMIGYDASQLSFPPISVPHPQLLSDYEAYYNRSSPEEIYMMTNNGFLYTFYIPTFIIIHNGVLGNDTQVCIPEIFNITMGPIVLPPKSMILFTIHPPVNISNPLIQIIVMPQVWLGGIKMMEFQINTFQFPTIEIYREAFNFTSG
ncbi:MAG: hypothetical protein ACFFCM_02960 [Promethearchaeota archaeon]